MSHPHRPRHHTRLVMAASLMWWCAGTTASAQELAFLWQDVSQSLGAVDVQTIAVDPEDAQRACAGVGAQVHCTATGGRRWERVLTVTGSAARVHDLLLLPDQWLAATSAGVWRSTDHGRHWRRIALAGQTCLTLHHEPGPARRLWVGTTRGVWHSVDGRRWQLVGGPLQRLAVPALRQDPFYPERLYAATDAGVWMTEDRGARWQSVLLAATAGELVADDIEEAAADDIPADDAPSVVTLAFHPERPHEVTAALPDGLVTSRDGGRSWAPVPQAGLPRAAIYDAVITHASAPRLYVATAQGVWTTDGAGGPWQPVYRGMTARRIRRLVVQPRDGSLWAATDRGVFHGAALPADAEALQHQPLKALTLFQHEPQVEDVQRLAIRASETDPAKIARWRRAAATQALLPTLSLGFDRDKNVSDHYDEGTYPRFQLVPTRDLDRNWSVSVSWNLGELIWNNDQTSIDSRSKLMVELRERIVAEATRLYFERRQLQYALALAPPEDPRLLLEHDLRVRELTAQLDALTGGGFSRLLEGGA